MPAEFRPIKNTPMQLTFPWQQSAPSGYEWIREISAPEVGQWVLAGHQF